MIGTSFILLLNFILIKSQTLSYNGFGLNILNSEFKRPIFQVSSSCSHTQPIYESSGKIEMEEFETLYSYSKIETKTINSKANIHGLLGGSYSSQYTKKKEILEKFNSVMIRSTRLLKRNTLHITNCTLDLSFRRKINIIENYILNNNKPRAFELIQHLIRDYGTHVITKSLIGGYLQAEINVESEYYRRLLSSDWENSILNNIDLAIVEVDGHDIDEVFTREYFNDISNDILNIIKINFKRIVGEFYIRNKIVGCMSPFYLSYDNTANFHNPSMCNNNLKKEEYFYGGSIARGRYANQVKATNFCPQDFKNFTIIISERNILSIRIIEELIFCTRKSIKRPDKIIYFGGGFSNDIVNFVTNDKSCPKNFKQIKIERNNYICQSDIETPEIIRSSVPFAGLIFKNNFVGLNQMKTPTCPPDFESYPIFITEDEYTVYVCSKLKNKPNEAIFLKQPPFLDLEMFNQSNKLENLFFRKLALSLLILFKLLAM
ncbi:unnamed protein product [Brachionus calyciflorus]|uniref:MACPF domain-containing protein n=1 Tax=Brachionus calyciflorus TaxID=104777 RepID=A0A813X0S0_9BILA|nr:unnamed protein product [Brachionus calyciflorus]